MDISDRHFSTRQLMQYFRYAHLPPHLAAVSAPVGILAFRMVRDLPDGPELTAGLRHLLEAKDCFVRAALPEVVDPCEGPDPVPHTKD